jgi:beta-galactosidase
MNVVYQPMTNALRRVGLDMLFPAGYEYVEYYAKGPWENYIDRQKGSFLGRYTTTVDDMFEMYPHPQSHGNRMDLRDLTLVNPENGNAIRIETEGQVSFSLSHYDQTQYLTPVLHPWELKKNDVVYATFDYMQRGLGNGSCGPGTEYKYYCPYGQVSHKMRVSTLTGVETGVEEVGVKECSVSYDAASQQVSFAGLPQGAEVTVVNFGGVQVGKATAAGGEATVSLSAQPKAPYIAIIRSGSNVRSHRFIRW